MESFLDPRLGDAVGDPESLAAVCSPVGPRAWALPLLTMATCEVMEGELDAMLRAGEENQGSSTRAPVRLPVDDSLAQRAPTIHAVARTLLETVLPQVITLLGEAFASCRLCPGGRAYILVYSLAGGVDDGGRVFHTHVDDADVTLNVAFGRRSGWTGSDLVYVESCRDPGAPARGRPGTPDPGRSQEFRHAHAAGTAVVHGEGAYHRVLPLKSGERLSLVVMAMRDDAPWKRSYLKSDSLRAVGSTGLPRAPVPS